jgi:MFS family permease
MPSAIPRAVRTALLVDLLVLLAELGAVVVVPWWITQRSGAAGLAGFSATLALAAFIAMPAAAPFGDRLDKGRQITWGLGVLCGVALLQLVLSAGGGFSLPALLGLALVQVLAASFVNPARDTVLTELVPPERLADAIRWRRTTQAAGGILGPLLAGAALASVGVTGALCLVAGLLFVAMLVASRVPRGTGARTAPPHAIAWWRELRAGLGAKWRMPLERGWTLVNFVVWIFQGPAVGLLIPVKVQSLGLQGDWLGCSLGALSLGVLAGSLFGSRMLVERFGRYRVRVGLGVLEGLVLAGVGFTDSPVGMLAGLVAAGFCNASMGLVGATHRALAMPQAYRVRLSAAGAMSTQVAGALGPALVGLALAHHGVSSVYTAWGLLMATCVLGLLAVPRLREFLTLEHDEVVDWYRREYPAIFK